MDDSGTHTVVIGLDRTHFELLEPGITVNRLPIIEHVIEIGGSRDIEFKYR